MGASEAFGVPVSNRDGAPEARVEIDGRGYSWVGVLTWGHDPFGAEPIAWQCDTCGLLTVDVRLHNGAHRRYYRLMGKILARLGLTKDGEPDAGA